MGFWLNTKGSVLNRERERSRVNPQHLCSSLCKPNSRRFTEGLLLFAVCLCKADDFHEQKKKQKNAGSLFYFLLKPQQLQRSKRRGSSNGSVMTGSEHEVLQVRRHINCDCEPLISDILTLGCLSRLQQNVFYTWGSSLHYPKVDLFCSQHQASHHLIRENVEFQSDSFKVQSTFSFSENGWIHQNLSEHGVFFCVLL